jgi:hypothetical protein
MYRDFPLTKNAGKAIRVGIDITDWTPYISLTACQSVGQVNVIRMSREEFDILADSMTIDPILTGLRAHKAMNPVCIGGLNLIHCNNDGKYFQPYVTVLRDKQSRLSLGSSSWQNLKRVKALVQLTFEALEKVCEEVSRHWPYVLNLCQAFCDVRGYASQLLTREDLLTEAITQSQLPELIKHEIICYHLDYLLKHVATAQICELD